MISRKIAALVAASLVMSSSAAIAQSAQPLSIASPAATRAGADLQDSNKLEGTALYVVGAVVVALLIWGAIELFGDDEEDFPTSP